MEATQTMTFIVLERVQHMVYATWYMRVVSCSILDAILNTNKILAINLSNIHTFPFIIQEHASL